MAQICLILETKFGDDPRRHIQSHQKKFNIKMEVRWQLGSSNNQRASVFSGVFNVNSEHISQLGDFLSEEMQMTENIFGGEVTGRLIGC